MADNFYFYEDIAALGNATFTDDGTGNDWLALSGDYGGTQGNPGAFLILSYFKYSTKPGPTDFAYAFSLPQGLATVKIYGGIENAMGGAGSEVIFGSDRANVLQGDPDDVPGGGEVLNGFAGDDTIIGMGGNDFLQGGNDNDLLFGDQVPFARTGNLAPGDDTLFGDQGNDTLFAGQGTNSVYGGDGYDTVDYSGFLDDFGNYTYRIVTNLALGTSTVYALDLFDQTELVVAVDTLSDIEVVIGSNGHDRITAQTSFGPGGFGGNVIRGGLGFDTLSGGPGVDALYGGEGDDALSDFSVQTGVRSGVDLMNGGNGNDYYTIFHADTVIIELAGQGFDYVVSDINYTLPANVERLILGFFSTTAQNGVGNALNNFLNGNNLLGNDLSGLAGNDSLEGLGANDTLRGGSGNDSLLGGTEDDSLLGGTQNDLLYGDAGNDILLGESGDDRLFGGSQNDVLQGGTGRDVLVGGSNADIFLFTSAAETAVGNRRDVINDFRSGLDTLDLQAMANDQMYIKAVAFNADGMAKVRYDKVTGLVSGDVDGNGTTDWQIALGAGTSLVATDLIL